MFFRKRKSEWFCGLLWAEEQAKGGRPLRSVSRNPADPESTYFPSPWYCRGVDDFCAHAEANNLYPTTDPEEI